jgi:hypothetical protein
MKNKSELITSFSDLKLKNSSAHFYINFSLHCVSFKEEKTLLHNYYFKTLKELFYAINVFKKTIKHYFAHCKNVRIFFKYST